MACEQAFIRTLRERGMRMTPQREMVLSVLHELADHASVDSIYQGVQARSAAVDPSTVYRTLELLDELDMLTFVDGPGGQRLYALAGPHGAHVHLVCQGCGSNHTVDVALFRDLADRLACDYGFVFDPGRLSVPGFCASCSRDKSAKR